jgi:hypothetical protein
MKYISINGNVIRKRGDKPIRVAHSPNDQKPVYANEVDIIGPAKLVYDPLNRIMRCGARCVIICKDAKVLE